MERLETIIQQTKPRARFDKAGIYRGISNEILAQRTSKSLVRLLDERQTMQQFAGRLGRAILNPYREVGEVEQTIKRNEVACGLVILRGLLNEDIVYKRLEKVIEKVEEDEFGNKTYIYKTIKGPKGEIFLKQWNLYVKDEEYVWSLFWQESVSLNLRNSPSIYKPKKRLKFFDFHAGPLVSNLNEKYVDRFSKKKIPTVYKQINKLQQMEWLINPTVLTIVNAWKKNPILTKSDIKMSADARIGRDRDRNITVATANQLGDRTFHFYWFLDTRGRFYCSSDYLNPQSGDLQKALLMLKNGKRLGAKGLKYLKIHLANTLGFDKIPLNEREELINNHLEFLLELFRDVLTNDWWFKGIDSPFQILAALGELYEAHELADPTEHVSHIPVGFDATCSGLMIMSMITRDETVGALTNLTNQEEIGDVYQFVADFVDWDGMDFWKNYKSKMRWLCKRPTMTRYYSAGAEKIAQAIKTDCEQKGIYPNEEQCLQLATAIVEVCNNKLTGPASVMKLFQKMGKTLSDRGQKIYIKGIDNGFPFIQSYTTPEKSRMDYKNGDERITLTYISKEGAKIDAKAVASGSSPNIVHHLDSQLCSWILNNCNYDVAITHDCFYSVAADCEFLYDDIRAGFYELFGERDVLQEIADSFKMKNTIEYGKLEPMEMLSNQFCFS